MQNEEENRSFEIEEQEEERTSGDAEEPMQEEAEENIEKTYPCKECNSIFSFPLPLEMHIKNNHEGKLECNECNFRADIIKAIKDHEKNFHGTIDGEMPMAETRDELQKQIDQLFDFGGREGGKRKRPTALLTSKLKNSGQLENSGAGQKRYNAKIVKAHSPDLIH